MSAEPSPTDQAPLSSELMDLMPYAVVLGIALDSASPQQAIGHLDWAPQRCTAGGIMHGGALMSLADSVAAVCAFLGLPDGASTTTTSSTTHLFRAVREGRVTATCHPLHRGRTQVVIQTDLTDDTGRPVAQVTQTQAILMPTGHLVPDS